MASPGGRAISGAGTDLPSPTASQQLPKMLTLSMQLDNMCFQCHAHFCRDLKVLCAAKNSI